MRGNIYIVDDDGAVRMSLQAVVSVRFGCVVRGFRCGNSFLDQVGELDPGGLLIDFHMPGMSGIDVLKAIAPHERGFIPIVLTGQGSVGIAVQAMKANAFDFLEKPYQPAKLIETIEIALSRFAHARVATERRQQARINIAKLSSRETEVLKGLIDGRPNKQIAHELGLSPRTVEIYRANLMNKLDVRSLSEALRIAFTAGLFPEDEPQPSRAG